MSSKVLQNSIITSQKGQGQSTSPFTAARRQRDHHSHKTHSDPLITAARCPAKNCSIFGFLRAVLNFFRFPASQTSQTASSTPEPTVRSYSATVETPPTKLSSDTTQISKRPSIVLEHLRRTGSLVVNDNLESDAYFSFPAPVFKDAGQPRALDSRLYPELAPCLSHRASLINPPPSHPCYSIPSIPPCLAVSPSKQPSPGPHRYSYQPDTLPS